MDKTDNKKKVLIAAPVHKVLTEGLTAMGYECVIDEKIDQKRAYELIGDCEGVITSTRLQLDRALLDAAPVLKWIGRMGSGMEVIDMEYAAAKGIACYGSPEGNCNAVGEHAVGMLLALIRRITWSHSEIGANIWKRDENRGIELEGRTLGIIGFGHAGAAFAKKLQGFDMRILAYDRREIKDVPPYVEVCDLATIQREADILSIHVSLQPDTLNYFNDDFLAAMKKPFILVNTSRGVVVNTHTLYKGIKSGKVLGACLDVFETEPLTHADQELRDIINELIFSPVVIATPHIAGYTHEALFKMSNVLLEKLSVDRKRQKATFA
ncbi:MAG: hydroxyacid dehydrogenase [Flavipsychrobacter sp.]|nr:hydroxyacid dehydrogenase [Flavipsychrobacter sp.]